MDELDQLPTVLSLPVSLPYPITIIKFLVRPGDQLSRGQTVLSYEFESKPISDDNEDEDEDGNRRRKVQRTEKLVATWETPIEGEMVQWEDGLEERQILTGPARILHVQQPCSHPVQFSGMCAICGKDLSQQDYLNHTSALDVTGSGSSSFPRPGQSVGNIGVEISHDSSHVKVSLEEAHRLALQTRQQLLTAKRLILVVDLDQTIIHAAVDPTIGEWLDECFGKTYNVVKLDGQSSTVNETAVVTATATTTAATTNTNGNRAGKSEVTAASMNGDALKDVFRFQLPNELPPELKGKFRHVFRGPNMCWYYVKPRPGLPNFLERMSHLYEMHVYTAGSRAYADAVCKGIDPVGKYFNERILSRDESGNVAQKDLRRLFPTDQSMVVVIDDRWEVWNHAPNLVKVVPYDFFIGMGDINAAFVSPRATDLAPEAVLPTAETTVLEIESATPEEALAFKQAQDLENQLEQRPLKRLQEELEAAEATSERSTDEVEDGSKKSERSTTPDDSTSTGRTEDSARTEPKAVLKVNDDELRRVEMVLTEVHGRFYDAFSRTKEGWRVPPSTNPNPKVLFDVRHIIPHMQRKVLAGCVILFSGIIPTFQRPELNEYWILASMFGAKCVKHLTPAVTHLVTAQANTEKVHHALKQPTIKVVWKEWLKHSVDMWTRQAEERYLVRPLENTDADAGDGEADTASMDEEEEVAEEEEEEEIIDPEDLELDQSELDEMDEELKEFMDGMTDSETGSPAASVPTTPSLKRTRLSLLNPESRRESVSPPGDAPRIPGRPVSKKARFEADIADDEDNEDYDYAIAHKVEEDYDEYVDEGGGELLSDLDSDVKPEEDEDYEFEKELAKELEGPVERPAEEK